MTQRNANDTAATDHAVELLGLFPAFHVNNAGGIQVSGELAWAAIVSACAAEGKRVHALQVDLSNSAPANTTENSSVTHTRLDAALRVLRGRWSPRTILCWHADLVRLLPLIHGAQRRVLFLHGIEAWQNPGWLKRRLLSNIDHILVNSEYTLARAREAIPQLQNVPSEVVPLGIGTPIAGPVHEPDAIPTAIMIGRLEHGERYKGHDAVIGAWTRVLDQVAKAQLWIVGEGGLRAELEAQVNALGLNQHVTFFGRADEQLKHELVQRARCLLLPSRAEGFGLVYLEAMRAGRPCLVSTHDAGREVVNPPECGLACDPSEPDDTAGAIARLMTRGHEWQRWSDSSRERYQRRFTASAFQQRLLRALSHA